MCECASCMKFIHTPIYSVCLDGVCGGVFFRKGGICAYFFVCRNDIILIEKNTKSCKFVLVPPKHIVFSTGLYPIFPGNGTF